MKRGTRASKEDAGAIDEDVKSEEEKTGPSKRQKKAKTAKPGTGFDTRWRFKVEPQPPKFPFKDEFFDLNIFLVDQDGVLKPGFDVPIHLDLFVEGESVPVAKTNVQGSTSITIDESTPAAIDKTGCARLRVKVSELSMNRNNRKFCFVVKRKPGPRGDLPREVNPVMTRAMLVIHSQIKITNELPKVWYKDQGGRDKCIDIDLELHGPQGVVSGVPTPVRCVLLYEDFQKVINQDILQPSPTTRMMIGPTGKSQIRVRIEDVSKNHQSKNFRIKVEPDTSETPMHFDKSPDISSPVLIRSKLNRRQKMKLAQQRGKDGTSSTASPQEGASAPGALSASGAALEEQAPRDFSRYSGEVATALWCHSARNIMASFSTVLGQFVQSFDMQIMPHVKQVLDKNGGFDSLYEQATKNDMGASGGVSLLPSESMVSNASEVPSEPPQAPLPMPHAIERDVSFASQNLAQLMRGTTQLLRGISGGMSMGGPGDVGGYPGGFRRDVSMLSLGGMDYGYPKPPQPGVPRMHSLAPDPDQGDDDANGVPRPDGGSGSVCFMLKHVYKTSNDSIKGLPAFDGNKRLVGFYQRKGYPDELVSFTSVENAFLDTPSPREHIEHCEAKFRELLSARSADVYMVTSTQDGYREAEGYFKSAGLAS